MSATLVTGPTDRLPELKNGEKQWARILGAGTVVVVAKGGGLLGDVNDGVAGTLAKFYDTPSGGTADDTTLIATVDISSTGYRESLSVLFERGLTVVVTGASADISFNVTGVPHTSPRTFGA